MKTTWLIPLAILALASCQTLQSTQSNPNGRAGVGNTGSETAPPALTDIWALRTLNGKVIDKADFPRRVPYMDVNVRDNHILGSTGCNRFTGKFIATANTVKIGSLASTKMACANGMSVETEFLNTLEMADSYKMDGKTLTLFQGATELMTLGKGD